MMSCMRVSSSPQITTPVERTMVTKAVDRPKRSVRRFGAVPRTGTGVADTVLPPED
jgi:hypothetical protein